MYFRAPSRYCSQTWSLGDSGSSWRVPRSVISTKSHGSRVTFLLLDPDRTSAPSLGQFLEIGVHQKDLGLLLNGLRVAVRQV